MKNNRIYCILFVLRQPMPFTKLLRFLPDETVFDYPPLFGERVVWLYIARMKHHGELAQVDDLGICKRRRAMCGRGILAYHLGI